MIWCCGCCVIVPGEHKWHLFVAKLSSWTTTTTTTTILFAPLPLPTDLSALPQPQASLHSHSKCSNDGHFRTIRCFSIAVARCSALVWSMVSLWIPLPEVVLRLWVRIYEVEVSVQAPGWEHLTFICVLFQFFFPPLPTLLAFLFSLAIKVTINTDHFATLHTFLPLFIILLFF